jgi:hypothetical protein
LSLMKLPMPEMSAAGLLRVNVTQRKLFNVRAVNSLSSTRTTSGKRFSESVGEKCLQNAS